MLKRGPWLTFLGVLLLAGFVFTAVLVRAAPVSVIEDGVTISNSVYGLERTTTSLARQLGIVNPLNSSTFTSPLRLSARQGPGGGQSQSTEDSRLVIHTVQLSLVVSDVDQALAQVENLTANSSGYVASSNTTGPRVVKNPILLRNRVYPESE